MEYSFTNSLGNWASNISKNLGKQLADKGIHISAAQWFVISLLYQKKSARRMKLLKIWGKTK